MRIKKQLLGLAVTTAVLATSTAAMARDTIQIAGSSTVLPFSSIVAEEFGQAFVQFKTPVVGSGGTGGGLRQFCQGTGTNTIDIANASRPIREGEIESCKSQGVEQILEIQLGYDGIVFASDAKQASFELTDKQIYTAAAAHVLKDGKWVDNPYTRWSEVDSKLPNQEIVLVIPASNHGTREVFEERVLQNGCKAIAEIAALDKDEQGKRCNTLRTDGRIVEIAGDYTETLTRLQMQSEAVGVFGLSFYDQNRDRLQVATINGVVPTLETIGSGEYPVSRPLFFYVKGEHIGMIPGLSEFVEYYLSDAVSGFGSPLEEAGLIPLNDEERKTVLEAFAARKAVN